MLRSVVCVVVLLSFAGCSGSEPDPRISTAEKSAADASQQVAALAQTVKSLQADLAKISGELAQARTELTQLASQKPAEQKTEAGIHDKLATRQFVIVNERGKTVMTLATDGGHPVILMTSADEKSIIRIYATSQDAFVSAVHGERNAKISADGESASVLAQSEKAVIAAGIWKGDHASVQIEGSNGKFELPQGR